MKKLFALSMITTSLLIPATGWSDVKLPSIFSDHMVLQKAAKVPVWGWAAPGEKIRVSLNGQTVEATANAEGKWRLDLDLADAPVGPLEMTVQGKNAIKITDVLVGEVWLASGQSNMELPLKDTYDHEAEIAGSANPLLRQFTVTRSGSANASETCEGSWIVAGPETSGSFTAAGYYFGKALQKELQVPIGLIASYVGGSPVEAWTSVEVVNTVPGVAAIRPGQLTTTANFPAKFSADSEAWIKANNRQDKATTEAAAFAGDNLTEKKWLPVKLPGAAAGGGIAPNGAFWLRKDLNLTAGQPFSFSLTLSSAYASVYWNGKRIREYALADLLSPQKYQIPADQVKEGTNVLAIRLYTPYEPGTNIKFDGPNAKALTGEWQIASEYDFPVAAIEARRALPPRASTPSPLNIAANLFNGMINPLIPYAIKGAIWYQGEANAGRAYQYQFALAAMITDWRARWQQGDFPFYICQLPNFLPKLPQPGDGMWAEMRESQSKILALPHTGVAVLLGLGGTGNIHPQNKSDVGQRLSLIALAKDYGRKVVFSGPTYESMKVEGGKIRVAFGNLGGGLVAQSVPTTSKVDPTTDEPLVRNSPSSQLEGFAICGADHKWVWADAKIDGNDVVVWSDAVPTPVAARYAWADNPNFNLFNAAGLPAAPFRTDDFPLMTQDNTYGNDHK